MSKSATQIIQDHGVAKVAQELGVPARNVMMWRKRDRIPPEHWSRFAEKQLATLEELAETVNASAA